MPFEYISTEEAIAADGLRMVVVSDVLSPWGEAAKGILHMKGISGKAVRLVYDSDTFNGWAKDQTDPIAIYNQEAPRSGWREILDFAERLAVCGVRIGLRDPSGTVRFYRHSRAKLWCSHNRSVPLKASRQTRSGR